MQMRLSLDYSDLMSSSQNNDEAQGFEIRKDNLETEKTEDQNACNENDNLPMETNNYPSSEEENVVTKFTTNEIDLCD